MLDAILDLTAFRYSDFGRFLVCYSPLETVPETVEKPFVAFFGGSTLFCRIDYRRRHQPTSSMPDITTCGYTRRRQIGQKFSPTARHAACDETT